MRPYRTLGYPVVPLLFVVGAGILLFSTALERPRESAIGLGLMALGFLSTITGRRTEREYRLCNTVLTRHPGTFNRSNSNQKSLNLFLVNPMNWSENRRVYWSRKRDSFEFRLWLRPRSTGRVIVMDVSKILAELKAEREQIEEAILSLERSGAGPRPRPRPSAELDGRCGSHTPKRRGRPPGSKNKVPAASSASRRPMASHRRLATSNQDSKKGRPSPADGRPFRLCPMPALI